MQINIQYPVGKNGKREPNKNQLAFHGSSAKYRAYVGGVGAGKTLAGCLEVLKLCVLYPGNFGLIGANTYPQLRDATKRTFLQVCPQEIIKVELKQENKIILVNGSEIIFRSFDEYSKFQGLELGFFYMDEASEAPEEIWDVLMGRLRFKGVPQKALKGFATTNPNGKNWVYKKFFDKPAEDFFGVVSTTYENKDNLPDTYISDMEKVYSADWLKRFLFGSFETFSGQIFSEFNETATDPRNSHVIQPIELPSHWYRFRSIDFGWSHPTCVLWAAESPDGTLYIYQELYKSELAAYELANMINKMSPENEVYEYTIGDTSGRAISQTDGESVYKQLNEYGGIQVIPALKQDKIGRIDRAKTMFKYNKIKIFNTCTNLIKELPQYQWEAPKHGQLTPLRQQRPLKLKDDAIDALMYLLGSRPDMLGFPDVEVKKEKTDYERAMVCDPTYELGKIGEKKKTMKVYY